MRLAGQVKAGFFPCPPPVIDLILGHLRMPTPAPETMKMFRPDDVTILDPCAGEGHAVVQLAKGLGITPGHTHALELNTSRANRIRECYPDIRVVGPCAFEMSRVTRHSFSVVYVNPPFDSEFGGGGREEVAFVRNCVDLLVPGGILVLVCPLNQVMGATPMVDVLDAWFNQLELYVFPDDQRKYGECVVFGQRRVSPLHRDSRRRGPFYSRAYATYEPKEAEESHYSWSEPVQDTFSLLPKLGEYQYDRWLNSYSQGCWPDPASRRAQLDVWVLPYAWAPKTFEKGGLTTEEVEKLLDRSPCYRYLERKRRRDFARPPLGLNKGHTSLVLLTGLLDGYVPSDPPHVVRGDCGKEERQIRHEQYENEAGAKVEKTVYSEVPVPIVRAVWPDGIIRTLRETSSPTTTGVALDTHSEDDGDDDEPE